MNVLNRLLLVTACCALCTSCATGIKEKIVRNSLIAGAVGAAYGDSKDEFKSQHSVMYGASAALITAIASLYYFDPDKQLDQFRKTTNQMRDEMDGLEIGFNPTSEKNQIKRGTALRGYDALPDQYKRMIDPGRWTLSEIDQWVEGGEGQMIHQDKLLELKPATIRAR